MYRVIVRPDKRRPGGVNLQLEACCRGGRGRDRARKAVRIERVEGVVEQRVEGVVE